MSEQTFVKGLYADQKNSKFGGFIKLSAKVSEVIEFLKEHENDKGYVHMNIFQVKDKKEGKNSHYCVLDTFVPDPNYRQQQTSNEDVGSDLPL